MLYKPTKCILKDIDDVIQATNQRRDEFILTHKHNLETTVEVKSKNMSQ